MAILKPYFALAICLALSGGACRSFAEGPPPLVTNAVTRFCRGQVALLGGAIERIREAPARREIARLERTRKLDGERTALRKLLGHAQGEYSVIADAIEATDPTERDEVDKVLESYKPATAKLTEPDIRLLAETLAEIHFAHLTEKYDVSSAAALEEAEGLLRRGYLSEIRDTEALIRGFREGGRLVPDNALNIARAKAGQALRGAGLLLNLYVALKLPLKVTPPTLPKIRLLRGQVRRSTDPASLISEQALNDALARLAQRRGAVTPEGEFDVAYNQLAHDPAYRTLIGAQILYAIIAGAVKSWDDNRKKKRRHDAAEDEAESLIESAKQQVEETRQANEAVSELNYRMALELYDPEHPSPALESIIKRHQAEHPEAAKR